MQRDALDGAELHADGSGRVRSARGAVEDVLEPGGFAGLRRRERHGLAELRGGLDELGDLCGYELQLWLSPRGRGVRVGRAVLCDRQRHRIADVERQRLRDVHGGELQQRILRVEQHGVLGADLQLGHGELRGVQRRDVVVLVRGVGRVHGRERHMELRLLGRVLGDRGVRGRGDAGALGELRVHGEQRVAVPDLELRLGREHGFAVAERDVPG